MHYRKVVKRLCIINPPNAFYVTALPCKILIAILVVFLQLKMSLFCSGNVIFCQISTVFVGIKTDEYYCQVLFQLTLEISLKLTLMLW